MNRIRGSGLSATWRRRSMSQLIVQSQPHGVEVGLRLNISPKSADRSQIVILYGGVVLRSQIDVLIFHLEAQMRRKRVLDSTADDITDLRPSDLIKGVEASWT